MTNEITALVSVLAVTLTLMGVDRQSVAQAPDAPDRMAVQVPATEGLPPWGFRQDPADSLYRAARSALNRSEYGSAAEMFGRIGERFPRSEYAPDALYWRAFALYRSGGNGDLRAALSTLENQRERYPEAATRGDAATLAARVRGELAQRGVAEAERQVRAEVTGAARSDGDCSEESALVRSEAVSALVRMNPDEAPGLLRGLLARRDDCSAPLRRRAVALTVNHLPAEEAGRVLREATGDPSARTAREAVVYLDRLEGTAAVREVYPRIQGAIGRRAAVQRIARGESPEDARWLRERLADDEESHSIRRAALDAVLDREGDSVERITERYTELENVALRRALISRLAGHDDPAALDALLEIVRQESSTALRRNAIRALAESDDPRVREFLRRIADF